MKAIIYGAGDDPEKWEAAREVYKKMTETYLADHCICGCKGFSITARRSGESIIINVHAEPEQPEEASK